MSVFLNIIREKCPKCSQGQVFASKGNIFLFRLPKMNTKCAHCHHKFEKEPGYFFGSMFVSYALLVAEMIIVFLIAYQFIESFLTIVGLIALMAVLWSTFNFRLSRMIWMYLLDGPDKQL